jgi:hypothetical protein
MHEVLLHAHPFTVRAARCTPHQLVRNQPASSRVLPAPSSQPVSLIPRQQISYIISTSLTNQHPLRRSSPSLRRRHRTLHACTAS